MRPLPLDSPIMLGEVAEPLPPCLLAVWCSGVLITYTPHILEPIDFRSPPVPRRRIELPEAPRE